MLIVAGLHVPLIPFVETRGSEGGVLLWQSGPIGSIVGVTCDVIVISNVVTCAHCPGVGVNVYVVVPGTAVLTVAGLQVPVTLFVDVTGNVGALVF